MPKRPLTQFHWFKLMLGLRPVLHRPRRRFDPMSLIPFLTIAFLVTIFAVQVSALSGYWSKQAAQEIVRVLDARELLKF